MQMTRLSSLFCTALLLSLACLCTGAPAGQGSGLCGLAASTNVASLATTLPGSWQCSTDGVPVSDVCTWSYVYCDPEADSAVQSITLNVAALVGTLDTSIGDLTALSALTIRASSVGGSLPSSVGQLASLTMLDLSYSAFNGTLPATLGQLTALRYLYLTHNSVQGSLPSSLGSLGALKALEAQNNALDGSLPTSIGGLSSLQQLDLSGNGLEGLLPTSLGQLEALLALKLNANSLTGPLPTSIGGLTALTWLDMSGNMLRSSLPVEVGQLQNLRQVSWAHNQLTGPLPGSIGGLSQVTWLDVSYNSLGGPLPSSLGQLSSLIVLVLTSNSISGALPMELGQLTNLAQLEAQSNRLNGTLPSTLGGLSSLQTLTLSRNSLTGSLPRELGLDARLGALDLSDNLLRGAVPSAVGLLWALTSLYLDDNQLSGLLPSELGNCSSLQQLRLDLNSLSGPIPGGLGSAGRLVYADLSDNRFNSSIPSALGKLLELITLDLSNNAQLTGSVPSSLCNSSKLATVNVQGDSGLWCVPQCYEEPSAPFLIHDSALDDTCGVCSAGQFYIPASFNCEPCAIDEFNPLATDAAQGQEVTQCRVCPAYRTTDFKEGQTSCPYFHLSRNLATTWTVLGGVLALYAVCWMAAGETSVALMLNTALPTMDHVTDINYVMDETFCSPEVFVVAAFFVVAPCSIFLYDLVEAGTAPPVWPKGLPIVWLGNDGSDGTPSLCGKRMDIGVAKGSSAVLALVWLSLLVAQLLVLAVIPFLAMAYWVFLMFWFVVGSFLHSSRMLAVGSVRRMWYRVWLWDSNAAGMADLPEVDVATLNRALFWGFLLETLPQIAVQVYNSQQVGWGQAAPISVAASTLMTLAGVYKFVYWHWFRGLPFEDIPVTPLFSQLAVLKLSMRRGRKGGKREEEKEVREEDEVEEEALGEPLLKDADCGEETVRPVAGGAQDKQEHDLRESFNGVHWTSRYRPPDSLATTALWLHSVDGVPTYRGVALFANFEQHDNPLKFMWLLWLWFSCFACQLLSLLLAPLWLPLLPLTKSLLPREPPVLAASASSEHALPKAWWATLVLNVTILQIVYVTLYPECVWGRGMVDAAKHTWFNVDTTRCDSTVYVAFICNVVVIGAVQLLVIACRLYLRDGVGGGIAEVAYRDALGSAGSGPNATCNTRSHAEKDETEQEVSLESSSGCHAESGAVLSVSLRLISLGLVLLTAWRFYIYVAPFYRRTFLLNYMMVALATLLAVSGALLELRRLLRALRGIIYEHSAAGCLAK